MTVLDTQVRLREDVQLSRPLLDGPAVVHRVKDPSSGRAFEVGAREHFLMTRLDGERTLADISDEYAAAFGRRLAESNWLQLLTMLGNNELIAAPGAVSAPAPAVGHGPGPRRALPVLLVLAVATVVFLLGQLGELLDGAGWLVQHPLALLAALGVIAVSAALHELGHAVAARWYGCRVTKVSVATLHVRLEGYAYLRSVRAQLTIAGIGGVINALVLLPLAVTWAVMPSPWLGGVLFLGLVQTLVNYVPLPPLDGYRMLGHALHTADLAPSSLRFVRAAAAGDVTAYPTRAKRIYTAYALIAPLLAAAVLGGAFLAVRAVAEGPIGTLGVVVVIVLVSMTIAGGLARPALKGGNR